MTSPKRGIIPQLPRQRCERRRSSALKMRARKLQGACHRLAANRVAIARKVIFFRLDACDVAANRHPDRTDRCFVRAARWSGDTADGDDHSIRNLLKSSLAQGRYHLFADCSISLNQIRRHAKHVNLGLVAVADVAAIKYV